MTLGKFKSFQVSSCLCARGKGREREGERRREKERERERFYLFHEMSLPFGLALPSSFVPKLLAVGRGVIAQAPSGKSNTTARNTSNNTTSKINSKPKDFFCFQH
jgi:hypothetical protein